MTLFYKADYWDLTYTDKTGEQVKKTYTSQYRADCEAEYFKKHFTNVTVVMSPFHYSHKDAATPAL